MKQYTTFLTLRTSPEDEREIARSCILTSYYHLREASFTCFTRAKINNPVASSSNPRPSGNAILPMPAGQAILKGGTSRQSPISVSTSGKHPKDPHIICTERRLGYRQASSSDWPGSFSFLGFDSRAAADRFTVLDMDDLNYFLSAEDSECVLTHPLLGIAGRMPHRVARAPSCCWPSAAHWSLIHVWGLRIMPRCIMRSLLSFAQPGQSPNGCLLWPGS